MQRHQRKPYVQKRFKEATLRPWQRALLDRALSGNESLIVCNSRNEGKSFLAGFMISHHSADLFYPYMTKNTMLRTARGLNSLLIVIDTGHFTLSADCIEKARDVNRTLGGGTTICIF